MFPVRFGWSIVLTVLCWVPLHAQDEAQKPAPVSFSAQTTDKPLPDLATLMAAVQKRQKNDEAIEKKYVFRSKLVMESFEKDGSTKPRFSQAQDVYWADGVQVSRTVERNGKPLTPQEQKKEDDKITKFVAERKKKLEKEKDVPSKQEEAVPLSRLLELGAFSSPRREMVNGRPTIAVDFTGDPKAKTHSDAEKVAHELAGTLWVDETDLRLQRVQGRLLNSYRLYGGFLMTVGKDTTFSFSTVRVNDELWMPESVGAHGHFRVLLLFAGNMQLRIQNSDFRKMRVSSTIVPGEHVLPGEASIPENPAPK